MTHAEHRATQRHVARPVVGSESVVAALCGALQSGLDIGEHPVLLASAARIVDVRAALGPQAEAVSYVEMDEHARNPGRVTSMLYRFGASSAGHTALVVRELEVAGLMRAAQLELVLGECLLNTPVLQSLPMTVVCVVDTEGFEPEDLQLLRRCHPEVQGERENRDFDAAWATELHASDLPRPPADAAPLIVDAHSLKTLRAFVQSVAAGHGLAPDRVDDLVLAANEAVSNSVRHGGGRASVRVWRDDGALVCEVRDHGYLRDPLTGRLPPAPSASSGRGLWLVHHLCDLVQLRSSEMYGTTVRLFVNG